MIVQGPGFRVLGNAPEHDLKLLEPYKPPAADTERETQQLDTPQTLHSTLYTLRKPCICASVSERLSSMYGRRASRTGALCSARVDAARHERS